MKKRIIIVLIVVLVIVTAIYIFVGNQSQSSTLGTNTTKESQFKVTKKSLIESLTLSGSIDAEEKATLFFPIGGKLVWVGVKEGDYVKKYQGIASLDQRDMEKKLKSSLNSFMISRWDFDQTKQDNKNAQYTDGDLGEKLRRLIDKSQFSLDNAVIAVEIQALAKEIAYLYSPIEGIVTKVGAPNAFTNITIATTFEVVNPQSVYFSSTADQTEIPKISVGDTAKITLDSYKEEITGVVKSVSFTPIVGDSGTTYEVKMAFTASNDLLKYRIGMTGDAEFVTSEKKDVYAVPLNYVKTEGDKKIAFILKDGKKEKSYVKVGDEGDEDIEIIDGVSDGTILVEPDK